MTSRPDQLGRYRIEGVVGRGGMAVVYRARDEVTSRTLALKQLVCEQERLRERVTRLFQREFQTLAELAHPHIVSVFEYGVADDAPYYTMELLDGDDLNAIKQLPWREVCALLRDVASALAVLHSRRLVHRDVTLRNVRRTSDGRAKLIDFGALAPMGESALLIGTPPFVAPELFHRQPLDGRADLFSLGALAYRLLAGAHAYRAKMLEELPERWRTKPPAPSALVESVPQTLSALVLSLLSLDVLGRPMTASEVIERLSGIAGLPPALEPRAARAYLMMPTVVGRDHEQAELRMKLERARAGQGSVVWIKGGPGSGRSRLLTSFVLEARIAGVPVLRADGASGASSDFFVMRALAEEMSTSGLESSRALPQDVRHILDRAQQPGADGDRQRAVGADRGVLVRWLLDLSRERGLLIAVDDLQGADPASAAVLGELVQAAPRNRVVLSFTVNARDVDAAAPWVAMLAQVAPALEPQPLTEAQTETLIASIFGDGPHLKSVAQLLHRISGGNPGTCMSMAQLLLDRGLVRYESGRFILPADPHALGLSDSVLDAFVLRIRDLGPAARELATALSLIDPLAPIAEEDYHLLLDDGDDARVFSGLAELTSSDIMRSRDRGYAFSHPTLIAALHQLTPPATSRALHARLASLYERAPYANPFMHAWHLQQAGDHARASELLVEHARVANAPENIARGGQLRSRGFYRFGQHAYETALQHCERTGAPPRALFELRRALVYLAVYFDPRLTRYAIPLLEQLRRDSGLAHWSELSAIEDNTARIWKSLELAQADYAAKPEQERCCEPIEAVRALAHLVSVLAGTHSRMLDSDALETLPELIDPFRPLAPALELVAETVRSCCDASLGLETTARCISIIESIESSPASRDHEIMLAIVHALRYYVGVWEARCGGQQGLSRADEIDRDVSDWEERFPYHIGLGRYRSWHVRRLAYLYNGDVIRARACRERIELLQLDGLDPLVAPNVQTGIYMEVRAHALIGALLELGDAIDVVAGLAETIPSWVPVLHWARGEYHKVRENFGAARTELELSHAGFAPGRHLVWYWATASLGETLIACGEPRAAFDLVQGALRQSADKRVQALTRVDLERVLALALAELGAAKRAGQLLQKAIAPVEHEIGGVPLGRLYEARAQIALLEGDALAFHSNARLAEPLFRRGQYPALIARYEKLMAQGQALGSDPASASSRSTAKLSRDAVTEAALGAWRAMMKGCSSRSERAQATLRFLIEQAEAVSGYLFIQDDRGLQLVATSSGELPPAGLVAHMSQMVEHEIEASTLVVPTSSGRAPPDGRFVLGTGEVFYPLALGDDSASSTGVVAALQMSNAERPNLQRRLLVVVGDYLAESTDPKSACS